MIKLSFELDPRQPQHVEILDSLVKVLGGSEAMKVDTSATTEEEPEKPKRKRRTKAEIAAAKEEPIPTVDLPKEDEPKEENAIEFTDVRALFAEKLQKGGEDRRDACIKKLNDLGAQNLPGLEQEKYQEFIDFLNGLEE